MRRLVRWIVDGLPLDDLSRRALDETMMDWTHESEAATTFAQRMATDVRGLGAIVRAGVVASMAEARTVPRGWLARRLTLLTVVPVLTMSAFVTTVTLLEFSGRFALSLYAPLEMFVAVWLLVPAGFIVLAWRPPDRRVPAAGTAALLFVVTFVLALFGTPLLFRWYQWIFNPVHRSLWTAADLKVIDQMAPALAAPRFDAVSIATESLAMAVFAAAGVMLGGAWARSWRAPLLESVWWLPAIVTAYLIVHWTGTNAVVGLSVMIAGTIWLGRSTVPDESAAEPPNSPGL